MPKASASNRRGLVQPPSGTVPHPGYSVHPHLHPAPNFILPDISTVDYLIREGVRGHLRVGAAGENYFGFCAHADVIRYIRQ